ncbi:MAG: hypothetical protein IJT08_02875, partial [Alphaproteobacteria bacterium]|nr:hypothetical protein [Alphaproteobacteria bacterium]
LVTELPDTPCKVLAKVAYGDVYKVHLAKILKDDKHPEWLNDNYKKGFYESSIWDYVRKVVADNAVEFNQNKDDIIKIAANNPAKFGGANWNAFLLKNSINRMFDKRVLPSEYVIDAAAEAIRKNKDYGKYWTNAQQTISDVKIYSRALRLIELIKDIKDNRHEQTFNDPEVNRACFENDPQQNEARLTKDVSLKWSYNVLPYRDLWSCSFCSVAKFENFKLFSKEMNESVALMKYELAHKQSNCGRLQKFTEDYDEYVSYSDWSIRLCSESGEYYKFDFERMRFQGDDLHYGKFLHFEGNQIPLPLEPWLCLSRYLLIKAEDFFSLFECRIYQLKNGIGSLPELFEFCPLFFHQEGEEFEKMEDEKINEEEVEEEESEGQEWRVFDGENVILLFTEDEWKTLHSLQTDEKYKFTLPKGKLDELLTAFEKECDCRSRPMSHIFDLFKYEAAPFSEQFCTDEYFKRAMKLNNIKNLTFNDMRNLLLKAWLELLSALDKKNVDGRVFLLSDNKPLDALLEKMADGNNLFFMTEAFAQGDGCTIGFKKRMYMKVYENLKEAYEKCIASSEN